MELVITLISYGITLAVIALIVLDYVRGRTELLSMRNVAMLGFVVFLVFGVPLSLKPVIGGGYNLQKPVETASVYLLWCGIFLVVALAAYRSGFLAVRAAALVPRPNAPPGLATMWALAVALTALAAPLQFGVNVAYVGVISGWLGTACCATSAGLLGWILGPRMFNPIVVAPAAAIILINAALAQHGEFSRRPLVSVGAAVGFGMYYSYLRFQPPAQTFIRLAIVALPGLFAFGLYSSVRNWEALEKGTMLQQMAQRGDAAAGIAEVAEQGTANVAMWLMEAKERGKQIDTRHLFTFQYFLYYPVPRAFFPVIGFEKPWPLSTMTAELAQRRGVKLGTIGITNPAGIIGNAVVEGGFYALLVYAVAGGVFMRFYDENIRRHINNPFIVLPVGSALGQTLGLARGETGTFAFILVFSSVSMMIIMLALSKVLGRTLPTLADYDETDEDYAWLDDHPSLPSRAH